MLQKIIKYNELQNKIKNVTNHSGRGGTITQLKRNGIDDRVIMKRSRHRNIKSLDSYDKGTNLMEQLTLQHASFTDP